MTACRFMLLALFLSCFVLLSVAPANGQLPIFQIDQTVASSKADGACVDGSNRYVDCANGTVSDTVTGLIWLKDASCLGTASWGDAMVAAFSLADGTCQLTDGSEPGDWRLPTREEWNATRAAALTLGCYSGGPLDDPPTLTNTAGTACISSGPNPFSGAIVGPFWTSTTVGGLDAESAYAIDLGFGTIDFSSDKETLRQLWPVRSRGR